MMNSKKNNQISCTADSSKTRKKTKTRIVSMLLILTMIAVLMLGGCGSSSTDTSESAQSADGANADSQTITITDHSGNEVTLPRNIERIAVCNILPLPSVLSVFFDSAEKIVAMAPSSMSAAKNGLLSELYPEILNADTTAISGNDVNTEELMKLDPQVVFYSEASAQIGDKLRKAGFNAVAISANKWEYNAVETLNQWIDLLTQIFPESANDRAKLVRDYSDESMDFVSERTAKLTDEEKAKVFFLFQYSDESIVTSGCSFFGQWWADAIGAINVANELTEDNSVKVTMEQVYSWNPEIILMTNFNESTPEDLFNNTVGSYDWSKISAVENKKVYKMPLGMYRSYTPGVDTPITLLWLAKTVYPDLFEDVDITAKTVEYYKEVFGIDLTSEQAASIFSPATDAGYTDF